MPALYPAKPWSRGVPPSTSGQLEKCGIGLSLRLRGEKPIDPCLGRCSFGMRHSSAESGLFACDEPRAFGRDTVTLPARPEESGPHFLDPRRDCPGASGRRVGPSLRM